jgi:hypothetical protein
MEWIMELVMNYLNDEKIVVIVQNDRKLLLNFFLMLYPSLHELDCPLKLA